MSNPAKRDRSWRLVCLLNSYGIPESDRMLNAARELLRNLAAIRGLECVWEEKIQFSSRFPEFDTLSDLYSRVDVVHLRPLPHSEESEKSIRHLIRLIFRKCCVPAPVALSVVDPELLERFPLNGKVLFP